MSDQHETVGRTFKGWDGAKWLCTRYIRAAGFDMRRLTDGEVHNVSERAIGRTYHRDYDDESYEPHDDDCECKICIPRIHGE